MVPLHRFSGTAPTLATWAHSSFTVARLPSHLTPYTAAFRSHDNKLVYKNRDEDAEVVAFGVTELAAMRTISSSSVRDRSVLESAQIECMQACRQTAAAQSSARVIEQQAAHADAILPRLRPPTAAASLEARRLVQLGLNSFELGKVRG